MGRRSFSFLLALLLSPTAFGLGPLFFTPTERKMIEAARAGSTESSKETTAPSTARLTGVVLAPAGRRGAWFSNRFIRDGAVINGYRLQVFLNGVVLWDVNGNAIALRIGSEVTLPW